MSLLALVCAHGILGERDAHAEADDALERSNEILERIGVHEVTELNEEIGIALAEIVPDASEDLEPPEVPDDPYLWGSGT